MKSLLNITIAFLATMAVAACGSAIEEDPLSGLGDDAETSAIESSTSDTESFDNSALRIAGSDDVDGLALAATGDQLENDDLDQEGQENANSSSTTSQTDSGPKKDGRGSSTAPTGTGSDRTEPTALVIKPAEQSSNRAGAERQTTSTANRSTTSRPPTTARQTITSTTNRSTTTARQTTAGGATRGRFATLPPGASLPSGAECAGRVRPAPETRSMNAGYNSTRGTKPNGYYGRVDGNFVGSTDEIIQWAACKWGIDEDWARAQVAKESWWDMRSGGDRSSDQNACHPSLRTGSGTCPESIGLMQVRYLYHREAFEDGNAIRSSSYNVDYGFAVWRACYNGELTWLNDVDRGATYGAGDLEGCLGVWFTGRWYVDGAQTYIDEVRRLKNSRIWEHSDFLGYKG